MPAYLIYFHPLQLEVGSANGVHRAIMADSVTSNDPCIQGNVPGKYFDKEPYSGLQN